MNIVLKCAIAVLKIIYFFLKLLPTRNKITMISRQSNTIPLDFKLLEEEIIKDGTYKCVILAHKLEPGIKNKIKYIFHMFRQMYHIATSKVVVLDSYCMVVSLLNHKKNLVVIQMWHAMGALKKFGLSVIETDTKTSALQKKMSVEEKRKLSMTMHMHRGYDYIFTSSEICAPYFAEAFGYPLTNMVVMPLPVVDILTDKKYQKKMETQIKSCYPIMKEKQNILFVPTFRPEEKEHQIQKLIDSIDYNQYNFIIKLHPLTKLYYYDQRVIWDKNFSSRDMMMAADFIITDYSAIVYEASLLNKPLYFYTYDYEEYVEKRDFYTNFKKELPGKMSKNPKEIMDWIESGQYDLKKVKDFSKKYICQTEESVCSRILNFINIVVDRKNDKYRKE